MRLVVCVSVSCRDLSQRCAPKARAGGRRRAEASRFRVPRGRRTARTPEQAARIDRGWQYLQFDDFRNAEREFAAALKQQPAVPPGRDGDGAISRWRAATRRTPRRDSTARCSVDAAYVPALVGRGQAMLELDRDADALASFEAALAEGSVADRSAQPRRRAEIPRDAGHAGARQGRRRRAALGRGARRLSAGDRRLTGFRRSCIAISRRSSSEPARRRTRSSITARPSSSIPAMRDRWPRIGAILEGQGDVLARWPITSGRGRSIPAEVARVRPRRALRARRGAGETAGRVSRHSRRAGGHARRLRGARSASGSRRCWRARGRGRRSSPTFAGTGRSRGSRRSSARRHGHAAELRVPARAAGSAAASSPTTVSRLLTLDRRRRSPRSAKKWQGARVQVNDVAPTHLELSGRVGRGRRRRDAARRTATSICCDGVSGAEAIDDHRPARGAGRGHDARRSSPSRTSSRCFACC